MTSFLFTIWWLSFLGIYIVYRVVVVWHNYLFICVCVCVLNFMFIALIGCARNASCKRTHIFVCHSFRYRHYISYNCQPQCNVLLFISSCLLYFIQSIVDCIPVPAIYVGIFQFNTNCYLKFIYLLLVCLLTLSICNINYNLAIWQRIRCDNYFACCMWSKSNIPI